MQLYEWCSIFCGSWRSGCIISKCIKSSEVVAYDDLGTEAIRKLQVENLPVIVVIDKDGNNLYETAIRKMEKIIKKRLDFSQSFW